ncbi:MAG: hypothetical protein V1746_05025 [bacterium]
MQTAEKNFRRRDFAATCAPWLIYFVVASAGYFRTSVAAALAVIILLQSRNIRAVKAVNWAIFALFLFLFLGAVVFRLPWVNQYSGVFASVALAAMAFGSLAVGAPFTAQYAREQVEERLWNSPHFLRVNQILTAAWGAIFILLGILALPQGAMQKNWRVAAISAALTLTGVLFTKWFPLWYRRHIFNPQILPNK